MAGQTAIEPEERSDLARLLWRARGSAVIRPFDFAGLTYSAHYARLLIRAQRHRKKIVLPGTITGDLTRLGQISGDLWVASRIQGKLWISSVDGDINVSGTVEGSLWVTQLVRGSLNVFGEIGGEIAIAGDLEDGILVARSAQCRGRFVFYGSCGGPIELHGQFSSTVKLSPGSGLAQLGSVKGGRFEESVTIGDGVEIWRCDFRQCADVSQFDLAGGDLFPSSTSELANPPYGSDDRIPAYVMASIYRQLRTNLEKRENRPEASRFYRGEMNSRLESLRGRGPSVERTVLHLYRDLSMYGQSVGRPIVAFLVVSVLGGIVLGLDGLDLDPVTEPSAGARWHEMWMFSVRSMLSFLNPPAADLSTLDLAVQIVLRVTGPVLIALTALAVRDKVAR